jgi:hypothetical protein
MNSIPQNTNVDDLTDSEIETLKVRVHHLSQELWGCTDNVKRLNLLVMLNAATADLLLLETNRQARKANLP